MPTEGIGINLSISPANPATNPFVQSHPCYDSLDGLERYAPVLNDPTPLDRSSFKVGIGSGPIKEDFHYDKRIHPGADHRETARSGSRMGQGRKRGPGLQAN